MRLSLGSIKVTQMKIIRWILGRIILFLDFIFAPKARMLSSEEKQKIAASSSGLSLYQYEACPFCVKVRRFLKAEGISLPLVNALTEPGRTELLDGGGKNQVPCLRIKDKDGTVRWLYESGDIVAYLQQNVVIKA
jgi:glutaredoxin